MTTRPTKDIERDLVAAADDMRRAINRFDEAELIAVQARVAGKIAVHAQRVEALGYELGDALAGVAS